jgi:hypothetical protein
MKSKRMLISLGIVASLAVVSGIAIHAAQDQKKYALKVPNGVAVSEFKGYDSWQLIYQPARRYDRWDPGKSCDHRGLQVWHSR